MLNNANDSVLPPAQGDQLKDMFGEEGYFFETIRDNGDIDLGTKILYLERAINEDCTTFLRSLDKLYQPGLQGESEQRHLELIRAFKTINDFCFNNEIQHGEYGVKGALVHYFSGLGQINAEAFKKAVTEIINARIGELRNEHEEIVTIQKTARLEAEGDIQAHTGWRRDLDLPSAQNVSAPTHLQQSYRYDLTNNNNNHQILRTCQQYGLTVQHLQGQPHHII